MPLEQDVMDIGRQLEKLVSEGKADNDAASDILQRLKELPITLDILQKTRIGMSVNVIRKASSKEDVQSLAKGLIKSWKKLLDGQAEKAKLQKQASTDKPDGLNRSDSNSSNSSQSNGNKAAPIKNSSASYIQTHGGDRSVREKCRQMLASSLKCEQRPDADIDYVAGTLEDAMFKHFGDTGQKYRNRIKSRVMNLRDKRNPGLRILVIDNHPEYTPEKFATMTPEQMASEELKKQRDEIHAQAVKDHQLAQTTGTGTSQFKCSKCGLRNCSYNQVQTRSADEPMTTFVLCNECGNRWKFC